MIRSKYHVGAERRWNALASKGLQGSYFIFLKEWHLTGKEQSEHHAIGTVSLQRPAQSWRGSAVNMSGAAGVGNWTAGDTQL